MAENHFHDLLPVWVNTVVFFMRITVNYRRNRIRDPFSELIMAGHDTTHIIADYRIQSLFEVFVIRPEGINAGQIVAAEFLLQMIQELRKKRVYRELKRIPTRELRPSARERA